MFITVIILFGLFIPESIQKRYCCDGFTNALLFKGCNTVQSMSLFLSGIYVDQSMMRKQSQVPQNNHSSFLQFSLGVSDRNITVIPNCYFCIIL